MQRVKSEESKRKVPEKYGIPKSTLADHKAGKQECGPHPNRAIKEALVAYIVWMADHGFPLTRTIIKCLALEIIKNSTSNSNSLVNLDKGLSDNWWACFKGRNPELTNQTLDSLDQAKVHRATTGALESFFK